MYRFGTVAAISLLCLGPSLLSPLSEASDIALLGMFQRTAPTPIDSTANTSFSPQNAGGGGVQFTAPLSRRFGVELDALLSRRIWSDSLNGTLSMPSIDLSGGLRFQPFSFASIALGAYGSVINTGSPVSYVAASDYGVYGGAQIRAPLGHRFSLLVGARYLHGLANVSLAGGTLSFRGVQALAGIQFRLSR